MHEFERLSLTRQAAYLRVLASANTGASDYSFINLWAWAEEYGLSWLWDNGMVWIRQEIPEPCLWAPVGVAGDAGWAGILDRAGLWGLPFARVPEDVLFRWVAALPGRIRAEDARGHWDYLYSVRELTELAGNRFHKKKNQFNQFVRKYQHSYRPIEPSLVAGVLAAQDDWCAWRDCEAQDMLAAENRAIRRVFESWEVLERITGGAVLVGDRVAAFTVGESFTDDTLLIHFEKGLGEYAGIYQAVNRMFLEEHREFSLVNREQDMEDQGLRQAKLSYNPAGFVRKYRVRIV